MGYLLNDKQIIDFIIKGYLIVKPTFKPGFHKSVLSNLDALNITLDNNPGNEILTKVPELQELWAHSEVKGIFASLLGNDFAMAAHRHCHLNFPATRSQVWHQDGINFRHNTIRKLLGMYYPQTVTKDMGPTALVPGTHFRNAPSDRMATYGNFRAQALATVEAGSILIAHYDIWHAATANTSDKNRYMLKFLFERKSVPVSPSWDYKFDDLSVEIKRITKERLGPFTLGSNSDWYKERRLRIKMLEYMLGLNIKIEPMPPDFNEYILKT